MTRYGFIVLSFCRRSGVVPERYVYRSVYRSEGVPIKGPQNDRTIERYGSRAGSLRLPTHAPGTIKTPPEANAPRHRVGHGEKRYAHVGKWRLARVLQRKEIAFAGITLAKGKNSVGRSTVGARLAKERNWERAQERNWERLARLTQSSICDRRSP